MKLVNAQPSKVWVADNGDGTYKNPVIHADYSDPDAIRVGNDYYMISSSFTDVPGLPVLHSTDLVNWTMIGYALQRIPPYDHFAKPQHGGGVWAPSIRYHNGEFYIYYPDPDFGIYLIKTKNIKENKWSEPLLVQAGKGLIDPCPLWDGDKVYLVHAFAGSRAGIKSLLVIKQLNATGTKVIDTGIIVYDGHELDPTIEGPKLYKRNSWYYIFTPAGGVSTGWQLALRSKNIYGPYERKVVMDEGASGINGPHQGAWVTTQKNEDWFLHFQDKDAYGRIVHLQPMKWINDWPLIGIDKNKSGKGNPVLLYKKPLTSKQHLITTLPDSDEFNKHVLGLQWQWWCNPQPQWSYLTGKSLRLYSYQMPDSVTNYWDVQNLLLQKIPAETFTATTKASFDPRINNERFGFTIMGSDYAYLSLTKKANGIYITYTVCNNADKGTKEAEEILEKFTGKDIYFKISVSKGAVCNFSYSTNGISYTTINTNFIAQPGKWVGAKLGFFCTRNTKTNDSGYADIDWIRFE